MKMTEYELIAVGVKLVWLLCALMVNCSADESCRCVLSFATKMIVSYQLTKIMPFVCVHVNKQTGGST